MPRASPDYTPYASVQPKSRREPVEAFHIDFPEVRISDAVGRAMGSVGEHGYTALAGATSAVAHSLDNLGSQLDKTGDKLWARAQGLQELQNENARSKAELEFDKYVATKRSQFNNLKGEAATEATYKAYVDDLEDQAKKLGANLPIKTLTEFNRSTRNQIGHAGISAAEHVASELRGVTINTSEARVNQWKDELAKTTDINRTQELIDNIHNEIYKNQVPARGWNSTVADEAVRKQVGEGYIGQIKTMARTNPWKALEILENPENKKLWDDKQYAAAREHVLQERTRLTSNNIATDVQSKDPDAPLEKKLEEADKQAKDKYPDDQFLQEATRQKIKERHHTHNEAVAEKRRGDLDTINGVLDGRGENANGNKPKNEEELYAYGGEKARAAFEALNETDKKYIRRQLNRIALGLTDPTPESEEARLQLNALRDEDPARFRDTDLTKVEDLRLQDRKHLELEQQRLRSGAAKLEADPRITKAWAAAKAAGAIDKSIDPTTNKSRYMLFRGVFREAIYAAQKEKGFDKPLTDDERVEVARMVQQQMREPGWLWGTNEVPLYKKLETVPKEVIEEVKRENPDITDEAILSMYRRKRLENEWNKYHKGAK